MNSEPMTVPPTPSSDGIYQGVSFESYCQWDAVNFSRLKLMSISPEHYKTYRGMSSKALQFGRLAHAGKLEAASVPLRYAVMPDYENDEANQDKQGNPSASKSTTYYRECKAAFYRTNKTREIVTAQVYTDLLDLLSALETHERAGDYLNSPGQVEVSYIWTDPDTGLRCKARADKVTTGAITDLKTAADVGEFQKSLIKFEYHRQASHYLDGWEVLTGERLEFRIVAVSKSKPISVRAAPIHEDAIRTGASQNRIDLERVAECTTSGHWPNIPDPDAWTLPEWFVNRIIDDQLNMEGVEDA